MTRSYGCFRLVFLVLLAGALQVSAQSNAPSENIPVFETDTRLVLVDVIAKDAKGNPVLGLRAEDFTIIDGGKAQKIRSFDEHQSRAVSELSRTNELVADLPVGVFTNWQPAPKSGSVNIILFDSLNTTFADQAHARSQLISFLQSLPKGQQIALYTLGDHLRIVQSISGSSDTLIMAANRLGALSKLDGLNRGRQADNMAERADSVPSIGLQQFVGTPDPDRDHPHNPSDLLEEFLQEETNAIDNRRVSTTLEALRELARSVAAVPGRKNLIWISGSFPLTIGGPDRSTTAQTYASELRKTAALLAAHQIAIYPIDARGLVTYAVGADRTGYQLNEKRADDAAYGQNKQLRDARSELLQAHAVMDELAEQTGGRAFYNTNGLSRAITNSIQEGSNYYTLAYSPAKQDWDSSLHKITVKSSRKDLTLLYRRGYYAVADPFAPTLKIKTTDQDV